MDCSPLKLLVALLLLGCSGQAPRFTDEVMLSYTPVKQQGESQLCWVYAMLAAIETEHIERGDSVNLSAAFIAHHLQKDSKAPASGRGMAATLVRLIDRYGVVPFAAMPDGRTPAPRWAFMLGAKYTPQEFARSVCAPGEYVALASCGDSSYYKLMELPLADNWTGEQFVNVPRDSLAAITERAVRQRHGVCWEGDTGDPGFDWERGVARLSALSIVNRVTDDHCMAVVGLARDEEGMLYFVMKNSWGTDNDHKGVLYMSADYFARNTVSIVLPKAVVANTTLTDEGQKSGGTY